MQLPNPIKLSRASQLSLVAVVVLLGAIFVTVNSALQQEQDNRSRAAAANYLPNPGCENGTNYFKGYQSSIAASTNVPPHSGSYSCRVVSIGGSFYDIESTQSIPNPQQGARYSGYAYVRALSNTGGKVYLALRESGGYNTWRTTYGNPVYLTTNWQLVTNTMTVQSSGRTSLDFYVVQDPGYSGQIFYVDDMYFSSGYFSGPSAPTATPIPTAVPKPTATPVPTDTPTPTPSPTPVPALTLIPTPTPTTIPTPTLAAPSATPAPGSTTLAVTLGLHGIGTGGDSASPNSTGNMNPLHPQRTIDVQIYNAQNQLVTDTQGTVNYDSTSGKFTGTVDLGTQFATGIYTVKIKTDQYLRGLVTGIQSITAGQANTLPALTLVTGDINGDNQINIVDYNLLIGCYSDLLPAVDCTAANNVLTDLNDDGHVNQFDYNLFLRELTNIGGQ